MVELADLAANAAGSPPTVAMTWPAPRDGSSRNVSLAAAVTLPLGCAGA